jgi:hypothetical protein
MTPDQLIELKNNPVLRGRLAKFFARECFRNSKLEARRAAFVVLEYCSFRPERRPLTSVFTGNTPSSRRCATAPAPAH